MGSAFDDVLGAAQAGAEWAIAALYREFNPALLRFFGAQAGDAAEDLGQETWIGAGRGLSGFVGDERAFRAWLFTIARRQLVAYWRTTGRSPTVVAREPVSAAADEGIVASEAARELVEGLPRLQAEVILLRVVAGLDAEEVGVIIGKSPGAVRVLQHRALLRLARRVSQEPVTK
jgi:RNA polymerase sigma-70 factor, ECF subfamily